MTLTVSIPPPYDNPNVPSSFLPSIAFYEPASVWPLIVSCPMTHDGVTLTIRGIFRQMLRYLAATFRVYSPEKQAYDWLSMKSTSAIVAGSGIQYSDVIPLIAARTIGMNLIQLSFGTSPIYSICSLHSFH
jgi:hypothetical protein